MSWFDATGLANIAKTALKEAQKTIDKALDIKDEEEETESNTKKLVVDVSKDNSFSEKRNTTSQHENEVKEDVLKENAMHISTWGSFTGSFFQLDNSKITKEEPPLILTQPQKLSLLISNKTEGVAPLATPETELTPLEGSTQTEGSEIKIYSQVGKKDSDCTNDIKKIEQKKFNRADLALINEIQNKLGDETNYVGFEEKVITRPKPRRNSSNRNSYISNRLSVLSTESEGKKSSESVEVLGSLSCTTSPDTDQPSISHSSSLGLPVSSSYTDSVEVIDSLASPSSIEVLVEGTVSGRTTQSSSINSPKEEIMVNQPTKMLKMVSSPSNLTDISPESFEVIPDIPEGDEELSIADSYTSASESTGPTVLEPSYQYSFLVTESFTDLSQASSKFHSGDSTPDIINKLPLINKNSCDVLSESVHEIENLETNKNSDVKKSFNENEIINQEFLINEKPFQKNKSKQDSPIPKLLQKSDDRNFWSKSDDCTLNKSDLTKNEIVKTHGAKKEYEEGEIVTLGSDKSETFSADEVCGSVSSYSDSKTIIANDSSCDEIALESSSEDVAQVSGACVNTNYKTVEKLERDSSHNHSFYVKSLLTEAMGEMPTTRETSPTLSEKSRSDLVKVGSEQTSGHTSGDDLETTTSSDIEIISRYSPNGDSSSTSRHSPAKLLHHNSKSKLSLVAIDILGKATQAKIKGHQREPSETSSFCSEDNTSEVEKLSKRVTELTEILEARESRLNDLRKSNLEMQEKNQELKKEMELAKKDISNKLSDCQTESEKDKLIKELKEEGEKLSKKELKQANLIKTLRAQEKSQQALIDNNKIQIQNLMKIVEDLKNEVAAKKESEKILNENVKQMSKKITRQDEEIANFLNEIEKAVVKAEENKILLDSKEAELKKCKELLAAENFELQDAKSIAELKSKQLERLKAFQENAEIELEGLRQQLKKAEEIHSEREKIHREEKNEFMRRLQEAEGRNEELAQSMSKATRPLLRQMEALQASMSHERETWEKQERNLLQKLEEVEGHLSTIKYHEKSFKQETLELRAKVSSLEEQLQESNKESATWKYQVSSLNKELEEVKQSRERDKLVWLKEQDALRSQINKFKEEIANLEHELSTEKNISEAERKKTAALQEQLKDRNSFLPNRDSNSPRSSPTLSFGRVSLSESLSGNLWPQFGEDGFETSSISGRCSNVYDNLRAGNTTSLIENLQSQLKMRDGEISQLQWELQRRDTERSALTSELSSLTSKIEEQESKLSQYEIVDKNLKELQTNYDALLEMYGEKVEEVEELRLDLQDVKDMYKSQIDQLLKKEKQDVTH